MKTIASQKNTLPAISRKVPQFQESTGTVGIPVDDPWIWPAILKMVTDADALFTIKTTTFGKSGKSLSGKRKKGSCRDPWETRQEALHDYFYGKLPWAEGKLMEIIDSLCGWLTSRDRKVRSAVDPVREDLRVLLYAARLRLAEYICRPNRQNWKKEAWGYFQELQMNLGKVNRLYFLTYTFRAGTTFEKVSAAAKAFAKDHLWVMGFGSTGTITRHDSGKKEGIFHVHLLVWSLAERSRSQENEAMKKIESALRKGCCGIGLHLCLRVKHGRTDFAKVAAYLAWNYNEALSLPRGEGKSVPKGARMLRGSTLAREGVKWQKTGAFSLETPARVAYRRAVAKYAAATGKSAGGNWSWVWRERKKIREYLEPEKPLGATITGADGYTYQVRVWPRDHEHQENYLISSPERGFELTLHGLKEIAKFMMMPGAYEEIPGFDPTTGRTAYWVRILGLDPIFGLWRRRG
jgi:hypothetical protein